MANNAGCLDLYTWLTWRCFQSRSEELIPLFGAFGLASQLGVQEYERERKFRERLRRWLEVVKLYWPECPAKISASGKYLEVAAGAALRPRLRVLRDGQPDDGIDREKRSTGAPRQAATRGSLPNGHMQGSHG